MEIDLTEIFIAKTEVIYKGTVSVFTYISRTRDPNSNTVKFQVCLQDKRSVDEEISDPTVPLKIFTGVTDWEIIKHEIQARAATWHLICWQTL